MTQLPEPAPLLALFTDFGVQGPYMGQMRAVLHQCAPGLPIVDLFADAPRYDVRAASYLLAAYAPDMPAHSILVCVIDPGVGSERPPMIFRAGERTFVGPGNGLFEIMARRAGNFDAQSIIWRPGNLSASFHGRDLFAPVAATLARGAEVATGPIDDDAWRQSDWPDDLARVIYLDPFGNVITGLRAADLSPDQTVMAGEETLLRARTFSDVAMGQAFWYENANGLVEIAVNQGSAARQLDLELGDEVTVP
jgi:S-adenosyl-L-methionine hydrolase (adenosine-forming)